MAIQEHFSDAEMVTILDETAPRLEEYSTAQEWYSALTDWFIETGLKVQKLPRTPKPKVQRPNTNEWHGNIGRAAYLIGVLALDGVIVIDVDCQESLDNVGMAVKLLACALDKTEPDEPTDMPYLHD